MSPERPTPSGRRRDGVLRPLVDFLHTESAGGVLLAIAALIALAWANSPWQHAYHDLWATRAGVRVGGHELSMDLHHWINDGLMAVFFFVVGLEIKREVTEGELADPRKAVVPAVAAVGGMVVPALLFVAMTSGQPGARGWGVPMATDIALAVGVLALAGDRVPSAAKVFLLALAIVDDIGAILVIAVVYSSGISFGWLAVAVACVGVILGTRAAGVRSLVPFALAGVVMWLALHEAGVHATLAGVVCGLLAPHRPHRDPELVDADELADVSSVSAAFTTVRLARESVSVVEWLEHRLHPWSSFVVVPLFALANAGVTVSSSMARQALEAPAAHGVAVGLLVGKPLGIAVATWLLVRSGRGALPDDLTMRQVVAVGLVAGIGFTVSLFISDLAFDEHLADAAKLAVLAASVLAAALGSVAVRAAGRPATPADRPAAPAAPGA